MPSKPPRVGNAVTRYAKRLFERIDGTHSTLAVLYKHDAHGDTDFLPLLSNDPEVERLQHKGYKLMGVYRKGITLKQLEADVCTL